MENNLKHCPFAAGKGILTEDWDSWFVDAYYVYCSNCLCKTDVCISKELAIKEWNRRV